MIHAATSVLCCRECDAATTRTERGWRAYLSPADAPVVVLCPSCSERLRGEDEAENTTIR